MSYLAPSALNDRRFLRLGAAILLSIYCVWCAAAVSGYDLASVMAGILKVETGGQPFAINDNSTRRSYHYGTKDEAVTMATYLMSLNHNIDMGTYQINSIQMSRGWSVSDLFDDAFNRTAAQTVFNEWLAQAQKLFGDTVLAWQRAIGGYNGGGAGLHNGNPTYETKVLRAMGVAEAPLDRGEPGLHTSGAGETARAAIDVKAGSATGAGDADDDDDDDLPLRKAAHRHVAASRLVDDGEAIGGVALLLLALKFLGPVAGRKLIQMLLKGTLAASKTALKTAKKAGGRR